MSRKPLESPNLPLGGVPTSPEANGTPEAVPAPLRAAQTPRGADPEIQCLARVDRLLAELSPEAAQRVIYWLDSRYQQIRANQNPSDPPF